MHTREARVGARRVVARNAAGAAEVPGARRADRWGRRRCRSCLGRSKSHSREAIKGAVLARPESGHQSGGIKQPEQVAKDLVLPFRIHLHARIPLTRF